MLWQERPVFSIGDCRRQVLEKVAQITVWLQSVSFGRHDEGVQGGPSEWGVAQGQSGQSNRMHTDRDGVP